VPAFAASAPEFTESVIREMTRLALRHGAINLAQGFPISRRPKLSAGSGGCHRGRYQSIRHHLGALLLRDAIAAKYRRTYGVRSRTGLQSAAAPPKG
jgi:aminotransferase